MEDYMNEPKYKEFQDMIEKEERKVNEQETQLYMKEVDYNERQAILIKALVILTIFGFCIYFWWFIISNLIKYL